MDIMLRKALRKYNGLRQQLDNVLLGDEGDMWENELKKFLAKRACWTGDVTQVAQPKPTSILELVSTVVIPATTSKFVAGKKFLLKQDGGICSNFGDNFKSWFLEGDGKIEEPITEQTLRYAKLLRSSKDAFIIAELGGNEKSEVTLSEVFFLMEKQKNGESGVLLNNGYANIFYVKDSSGVLRVVRVYWRGYGWYVYAREVSRPSAWGGGDQVFSRNLLST